MHNEDDFREGLKKVIIGCDEVGTGELFRPSVFCACAVNPKIKEELEQMGIRDSKKISRKRCVSLAKELIARGDITYKISFISNRYWNDLTTKMDIPTIMARCHDVTIRNLIQTLYKERTLYKKITIDKFCDKNYFREQTRGEFYQNKMSLRARAEDDNIAVACASIIATYYEELAMEQIIKERNFNHMRKPDGRKFSDDYERLDWYFRINGEDNLYRDLKQTKLIKRYRRRREENNKN